MTIDIDRLIALAKAATAGPWHHDGRTVITATDLGQKVAECWVRGSSWPHRENTAFIAACDPQTILALCAENKRLTALQQYLTLSVEHMATDDEAEEDRLADLMDPLWNALTEAQRNVLNRYNRQFVRLMRKSPSTSAAAEGAVTIPQIPTEAMLRAGAAEFDTAAREGYGAAPSCADVWDAMYEAALAAAPGWERK